MAPLALGDVWILGGVCYSFATGKRRTVPLLEAVLDPVLSQPAGPRFIAGDLNLETRDLPQAQLLRATGFVEVQDLHVPRTSQEVEVTCKGKTRKDYVFISPELQAAFINARVDPTFWADHSVVSAKFCMYTKGTDSFLLLAPADPKAFTGGGHPSG